MPESVRVKCALSERLRDIRIELFGERGGSEMARRLGLPIRTWYNYEAGVTVPAEVLLRFVELTNVEPLWLLHGKGPRYRAVMAPVSADPGLDSVEALLRTALQRLERTPGGPRPGGVGAGASASHAELEGSAVLGTQVRRAPAEAGDKRGTSSYIYKEWSETLRDCRAIQVRDESMSPIVSPGAYVAYTESEDAPEMLEGELVVAWIDQEPVVRWFERSGRYGILRAENPGTEPGTILLDLEQPGAGHRLRRVLWISTPHH